MNEFVTVHEANGSPVAVFVLIHGTFASGAAWTLSESSFCQSLLQSMGSRIAITRFTWSGRNSIRARAIAADNLRGRLVESLNMFPEASTFLSAILMEVT